MSRACLILGFAIGIALSSQPTAAQYTADFQTNIVSGVTSNWTGSYKVGSNTFANVLQVTNGGVLSNGASYLGYEDGSSNNTVLVDGPGSVWENDVPYQYFTSLYLGYRGAGNSLIIRNGGKVISHTVGESCSTYVGLYGSSSNNTVLVTDLGSTWSNSVGWATGYGSGNTLVISNGGQVADFQCDLGYGTNNTIVVTGVGSVWKSSGGFYIYGSAVNSSIVISDGGKLLNTETSASGSILVTGTGSVWSTEFTFWMLEPAGNLVISNGGGVFSASTRVGGVSNTVLVTGPGSVWQSPNFQFGADGRNDTLVIREGGQVYSDTSIVGKSSGSNTVILAAGGLWQNSTLCVGDHGSSNSLIIAGGSVSATNLTVGFTSTGCNNLVCLNFGDLTATNASHSATLEIRKGKMIFSGGTLQVDRFIMTNACAQFVRTGGSLIYGTAELDPIRDDDGDGLPNGYEQSFGLDPLNAIDGNADSDGDGFINLQEYQAGTDPTNSASVFRITSVALEGNDLRVTWTMGSGRTNALQRTASSTDGSYSNDFTDIFAITNTVGSVTNYLDVGATTNGPARLYRVRLVP